MMIAIGDVDMTRWQCFIKINRHQWTVFVLTALFLVDLAWSSATTCVPGIQSHRVRVPIRPPIIDVGSYEIVTSHIDETKRDVFIYWQNTNDNDTCDESLEYRAFYTSTTSDNKKILIRSNHSYANHATFIALNTSIGYNFRVYAANKDGFSTEFATIYVPSSESNNLEPLLLTKREYYDEGIFELSWKRDGRGSPKSPTDHDQLIYYTLFWCEHVMDRPYICNGYMDWLHLPGSKSSYNITVPSFLKKYQFAISANTHRLGMNHLINNNYDFISVGGGMVWEPCAFRNNKVGYINNVWVSVVGSTYLGLRWKIDCTDRIGLVEEYTIRYCPATSVNSYRCKGRIESRRIIIKEMKQDRIAVGFIINLKPSTMYIMSVRLFTRQGIGFRTDRIYKTTESD